MPETAIRSLITITALCFAAIAGADTSPQQERHETMEGVRDAAKPVGAMLRGKQPYDAAVVMASLETWRDAAEVFGDLFPEGSEAGPETRAAAEIWLDREGFNAALANWLDATNAAIEAAPTSLEAARPVLKPAFQKCKACHDKYRTEEE
jgi:cytochrome c556